MGDRRAQWLEIARRLAEAPDDEATRARLAAPPAPPDTPDRPGPADLHGRPAPLPAAAWHASRLVQAAEPLERRYHARWLWYLLAPEEPASWPLISLVIPAYNRHDLLLEAIDSVLATGYPRLQFCICDDASREDPWPRIRHLGERLRYRRLERNGGVAVARQAALELAEGELVRLLDTDDLLLPDSLPDELAALAAIPDAELCFATQKLVSDSVPPGLAIRHRLIGQASCASMEGGPAMVRALPFLPSTVLVARHRMLRVGFDRAYRYHEDRLAFARLGLDGIKCVALRQPRTVRRWLPESASRNLRDDLGDQARVNFALLEAALAKPPFWIACGTLLEQLFQEVWGSIALNRRPHELDALESLLRRLEALTQRPPAGLSARPLLADLARRLELTLAREPSDLGAATLARLRALEQAASPPGAADLAVWRATSQPELNAAALGCLFQALSAALRRGRPWVPLATLDQRPFRSLPHGAKRRWKALAALARNLGEGPARLAGRLLG